MTASRVVYTAITNGHAALTARPDVPDTDFICYSDVALARDDWDVRPIAAPERLSPRMQAKYHKLHPPSGYAWSIWVDGSYILRTDAFGAGFVDALILSSPSGLGLHRHNARNCLYLEAMATMSAAADKRGVQRAVIAEQIRFYDAMGHPRSWGLWAGGLMCRDSSDRVAVVMARWWSQLLRWSWRDQISLPFVLRELDVRPDEFPWPLFQNPYMAGWTWNQHDVVRS